MNWNRDSDSTRAADVEYFQQLADGAPVMIWMSGLDMGCFYFNRAWLDYRGRTHEQEFGNGWAEGVHPEDLEACVQHYVSSFEHRAAFAMSYRLQHHSGAYRWILDRGVPHYDTDGEFLGFYGGCAETPAETALSRIKELRLALRGMRDFAKRLASAETVALNRTSTIAPANTSPRQRLERRARFHAATEMERLATDMLTYDHIPNGARLR